MDEQIPQSKKQKLIALVQGDNSSTVIELIKMVIPREKLIGDNEFSTIVNAVKFDTREQMILDIVQLMEEIKNGSLNETII